MAETLNISLSPGQLAWIKSRKTGGGYASASDFIRDLIRREQEKEWAALQTSFEQMSKDGAPGPEPVGEIMAVGRKVKRERRHNLALRKPYGVHILKPRSFIEALVASS